MTGRVRLWLGLLVSLLGGLFIGWIDESMRWSDNARVGFCLVVFAAAGVFIAKQKPWLALIPAMVSAYITHLAIDRSDLVV